MVWVNSSLVSRIKEDASICRVGVPGPADGSCSGIVIGIGISIDIAQGAVRRRLRRSPTPFHGGWVEGRHSLVVVSCCLSLVVEEAEDSLGHLGTPWDINKLFWRQLQYAEYHTYCTKHILNSTTPRCP